MDVFRSQVSSQVIRPNATSTSSPDLSDSLDDLQQAISSAERPLILAGGGIRAAQSSQQFKRFIDAAQIPVVNSLLACDLLPHGHPQRVGMIGTYGNRWANIALSQCDLLLVLGSRLDIRQTGADTQSLAAGRKIFHVDVNPGEINNRVPGCHGINADLRDFFAMASSLGYPAPPTKWIQSIADLRVQWPDHRELQDIEGINPNVFLRMLSHDRTPSAYCVDVGLHQMWSAQSLEIGEDTRFLTSGGMGAMGFALPAAIGASLYDACKHPVVVIAGDAGFQLNIQELQTIVQNHLPIKMVIMNNHCHGMTRQFQDTYFGKRYAGTVWGYSTPKFAEIGNAYGIASKSIRDDNEMADAIDWFWSDPTQACLLEVLIDLNTNAYPKLAFGRPISEMEPLAKPIEMEST